MRAPTPLEGAVAGFFALTTVGTSIAPDRMSTVMIAAAVWPGALLWRMLLPRSGPGERTRRDPDVALVLLLVGAYGIGLVLSPAPLGGVIETALLIGTTGAAALVGIFARPGPDDRGDHTRVLAVAEIGLLLACAPAVFRMVQGGVSLQNRLRIPELGGTNLLAMTAAILVLLRLSSGRVEPRHLAAAGANTVIVCLTFSRAAVAGLLIGLGVLGALRFGARLQVGGQRSPGRVDVGRRRTRSRRARRRRRRIGLALAAAATLAAAVAGRAGGGVGAIVDRYWNPQRWKASGRGQLLEQAVAAIERRPWTGVGPRLFEGDVPQLEQRVAEDGTTISSHNQFVQFVLELGIPLGLVALGVWLAILVRASGRRQLPAVAAVVIVSFSATFLDVAQVQWAFALLLAGPVAGTRRSTGRRSATPPTGSTVSRPRIPIGAAAGPGVIDLRDR
ncbi:MAG: O-antigen ligase family protein [Actinomycetota bacterium]